MRDSQAASIYANLCNEARSLIGEILVFEEISSTNQYLLDAAAELPSGSVCLAHQQSSGRGRRGKVWQSPSGHLYLSLLWSVDTLRYPTSLLPLWVGVVICECLQAHGVTAGVKWPNDVMVDGKKLAGILVESKIQATRMSVVLGIGMNIKDDSRIQKAVSQPCISMEALGMADISPDTWAVHLINALLLALSRIDSEGLDDLCKTWHRYDLSWQKSVKIMQNSAVLCGLAKGIDASGRLLVETGGVLRAYSAGEVSLRIGANE